MGSDRRRVRHRPSASRRLPGTGVVIPKRVSRRMSDIRLPFAAPWTALSSLASKLLTRPHPTLQRCSRTTQNTSQYRTIPANAGRLVGYTSRWCSSCRSRCSYICSRRQGKRLKVSGNSNGLRVCECHPAGRHPVAESHNSDRGSSSCRSRLSPMTSYHPALS